MRLEVDTNSCSLYGSAAEMSFGRSNHQNPAKPLSELQAQVRGVFTRVNFGEINTP